MPLEIQVLAWGRHKNVVGLNLLMGSQPSPLDHRPDFTRTTKKRKSAIRSIEYTIKKKRNRNGKIRNKKVEFRFKADENQVCDHCFHIVQLFQS